MPPVRLALLGVRGSTPAPGHSFLRYGGHTSCVAVLDPDGTPRLVLDAGTGARELPDLLGGKAFRGAVVLSHLHWDHVYGLPFSTALDHPGARVQLWLPDPATDPDRASQHDAAPSGPAGRAREVLAAVMSPPYFPIDPTGLLGSWEYRLARQGRLPVEDIGLGQLAVRVAPVTHKGGPTFAVRVDLDGVSFGYVPDHALTARHGNGLVDISSRDTAAVELVRGVDVLVHDGQFLDAEAGQAAAYGHATIEQALRWADHCLVGRLVLTHHAPTRTDPELDALVRRFPRTPDGRPVGFARQGDLLDVTAASAVG